jgi:hypothetical protein
MSLTIDVLPSTQQKRCGKTDCKKKLTLTDTDCRCGIRFCMTHRHAELHNCSYDYRGQALLNAQIVKCVAPKVEKI